MFKFESSIPSKISPCPIKDVAAEIRYSDEIPIEVTVGVLCNSYKKMPQRLPINDLPIAFRLSDPNLKHQAHYLIDIDENIVVRISLAGVSIAIKGEYLGWEKYFRYITDLLNIEQLLSLIKIPERLGLRYTSFFNNDISDHMTVSLNIANNDFTIAKNYIRSEWLHDKSGISCTLQISNNVTLKENGKSYNGSLIDIDTSTTDKNFSIDLSKALLTQFHEIGKKVFFSLLKPDFLASLNPEY